MSFRLVENSCGTLDGYGEKLELPYFTWSDKGYSRNHSVARAIFPIGDGSPTERGSGERRGDAQPRWRADGRQPRGRSTRRLQERVGNDTARLTWTSSTLPAPRPSDRVSISQFVVGEADVPGRRSVEGWSAVSKGGSRPPLARDRVSATAWHASDCGVPGGRHDNCSRRPWSLGGESNPDLRITSALLYRLSYPGAREHAIRRDPAPWAGSRSTRRGCDVSPPCPRARPSGRP